MQIVLQPSAPPDDVVVYWNYIHRVPNKVLERAQELISERRFDMALATLNDQEFLLVDHSALALAARCAEFLGNHELCEDLWRRHDLVIQTYQAISATDASQRVGRRGDLAGAKAHAARAIELCPRLAIAYQNYLCAVTLMLGPEAAAEEAYRTYKMFRSLFKKESFRAVLEHDEMLTATLKHLRRLAVAERD